MNKSCLKINKWIQFNDHLKGRNLLEKVFSQICTKFEATTPFKILPVDHGWRFQLTEPFDPDENREIFHDEGQLPAESSEGFSVMTSKKYLFNKKELSDVDHFLHLLICNLANLLEIKSIESKDNIDAFTRTALDATLNLEESRIMASTLWFSKYRSSDGRVKEKIPLGENQRKKFMATRYLDYEAPLISIPGKNQSHIVIFSHPHSLVSSIPIFNELESNKIQLKIGYGIQHSNQIEVFCAPKLP